MFCQREEISRGCSLVELDVRKGTIVYYLMTDPISSDMQHLWNHSKMHLKNLKGTIVFGVAHDREFVSD